METAQFILIIISAIASVIALIFTLKTQNNHIESGIEERQLNAQKDAIMRDIRDLLSTQRTEISKNSTDSITMLAKLLKESMDSQFSQQRINVQDNSRQQGEAMNKANEAMQNQLAQFEKRLSSFATENEQKLENIRKTVDDSLKALREDNSKKLDEIRKTVDEKLQDELQKRMRDSFAEVSRLLTNVQKDIGSMRNLAEDVGGLKRSLTNIKSRGMIGEFQLESILSDVFSKSQYEKNAHPNPDSPNSVVEFALKIPTDDDEFVYLPIDSKFPRDTYDAVITASETGDKSQLDNAIKQYTTKLKLCAAEIKKYIAPPYTTDYAILFLPTESMYADAVNHGMLDEIWRLYKVYLTGPSTVAALLGSMQLSFSNMAIQKRASEVFCVLTEVQQEFGKFESVLTKMQSHLNATSKDLEDLLGTRSRQLTKKLNGASRIALDDTSASSALPFSEDE